MQHRLRLPIAVWLALVFVLASVGGADAGQGRSSPRPFLIALDPQTGEERWRNDSPRSGVRRVLGETKALVFAYDTECARVGGPTTRASIIAFDRETGDERWQRRISVASNLYTQFQFGFGETIAVLGRDGRLHGLRPATGEVRWRQPIGDLLPETGSRDAVVLTSQPNITDPQARDAPGEVRVVDRITGEVRWSFRQEGLGPLTQLEAAIVGSDTVIVTLRPFGDPGGVAVALDMRTGEELWRVSPAYGNVEARSGWSLVFGPTRGPPLVAYDPRTRQQLWASSTAGGLWDMTEKLVLAAVAGPDYSTLLALDAETGTPIWAAPRPGSDLDLGHGTVISADPGGQVTALDASTGDIRWRKRVPRGGGLRWLAATSVYVSGGCFEVDEI